MARVRWIPLSFSCELRMGRESEKIHQQVGGLPGGGILLNQAM